MYNLVGFLKGLLIQNEVDVTKQLVIQVSPSATTGTTTTITAAQTADRTITLPDTNGSLMTPSSTDTLTNKTISGSNNTLLNLPGAAIVAGTIPATALGSVTDGVTLDQSGAGSTVEIKTGGVSNAQVNAAAAISLSKLAATTANRVLQSDGSGIISPSAVTSTTLGFLDATSSIQTQLNSKPTTTGSFTDNHVVRADGTANVQTSNAIIDDSGNLTGVNSLTLPNMNFGVTNGFTISSTGSSALRIAAPSNEIILQNNVDFVSNPAGTLVSANFYDIQSTPHKVAVSATTNLGGLDFAIQLPAASGTFVVDTATQNISGKTFTDALLSNQIATPSTPAAGKDKLYFKSDNRLYTLNPAGLETLIGNQYLNVLTKTANYSAAGGDDVVLCNTTTAAFSVFLPTPTSGTVIRVKKTSSDTNRVTVSDTVNLIDGASTFVLNGQYDEVALIFGNGTWNVIARYSPVTGAANIVQANSAGSGTVPATSGTWQNIVGNNLTLNPGTWVLNATLQYTNSGGTVGYGDKFIYWCGATGNNTATTPAALNTLTGLTVLGGMVNPRVVTSIAENSTIVEMPTLVITLTQQQTIFVGMRAVMTTPANAIWIPQITARRLT